MIARFRRYIDNVGWPYFIGNGLVLVYLMSIHVSIARSSAGAMAFELAIALPLAVAGLFGPLLMLGFLVRHASRSIRAARLFGFVVVAWIAANYLTSVQLPFWLFIVVLFLMFLSFGLHFWVISDPRVLTTKGFERVLARGAGGSQREGS